MHAKSPSLDSNHSKPVMHFLRLYISAPVQFAILVILLRNVIMRNMGTLMKEIIKGKIGSTDWKLLKLHSFTCLHSLPDYCLHTLSSKVKQSPQLTQSTAQRRENETPLPMQL